MAAARSVSSGGARTLLIAGMLACLAGCSDLPNQPADAARMTIRGITLADWTATGYTTPQALAQVDRIAADGANMLPIVVTVYQDALSANDPAADAGLTPTDSSVAQLIFAAKTRSVPLGVSLKLHVDLYDGQWRGHISPSNPTQWFASYGAIVRQWAILAEASGAEQLVIGTELAGTLEHEQEWRALIADARLLFSGEILYAASWDEAREVPFWDALDLAGVNFYAPVAIRKNAHRFEILREWQPWLERFQLLHKLADRDIIVSEIGYRSVDGAGMHPYEFGTSPPVDLEEQADLYWAALQAMGDKPWIRGVYWWNWLANGSPGAELLDYSPKDKPAETELIDAWQ